MTDDERLQYVTANCAELDEREVREELLWACQRLERLRKGDAPMLRPMTEELLDLVLREGVSKGLRYVTGAPPDDADVEEVFSSVLVELRRVFYVSDARPLRPQRAASKSRPNAWQPWTPELDADLARRWLAREPVKEIAKTMGRSLNAITARLVRLGVVPEASGAAPPG